MLVTIPQAPADRLDAVVRACAAADVPCRFVRRETDLDPVAVLGAAQRLVTAAAPAATLPAAAERSSADRLTNAVPLVVAFLWLCVLYGWQTRGHVTPWLFTDELKYTQIARSIAETGQAARAAPLGRLRHALHLLHRAVLADPRRPHRLRGDQVLRRDRDDVGDLPDVLPRADGRLAALGAVRRGRRGRRRPALAYASFMIEEPLAYPGLRALPSS